MRIGVDTHTIAKNYATGCGTYTVELVRALVATDRENEYFLYAATPHPFYQEFSNNPRVTVRTVLSTNPLIRDFWSMPRAIAQDALDVVHLQHILPPFVRCASVLMVHDLHYVHLHPTLYTKVHGLLTAWSIRRAKNVVTGSEFSRQDIADTFSIDSAQICLIPHGVNRRFVPVSDQEMIRAIKHQIGIQQEYILFVGRTEDPRKNLMTLVEAYGILKSQGNTSVQLVLAGRQGAGTELIRQHVRELGLEADVIMPGIVAGEDLPALLSGASVFVFASSFEGFGLPVLEAMACGVPVITSNVSSLPEVAGDAAFMVTPRRVDELVQSLRVVLHDETLRQDMRKRGLRRAALFSWEQTARQTLAVYERTVCQRE